MDLIPRTIVTAMQSVRIQLDHIRVCATEVLVVMERRAKVSVFLTGGLHITFPASFKLGNFRLPKNLNEKIIYECSFQEKSLSSFSMNPIAQIYIGKESCTEIPYSILDIFHNLPI